MRLTKTMMIFKFDVSKIYLNFLQNKEADWVEANQNYGDILIHCKQNIFAN